MNIYKGQDIIKNVDFIKLNNVFIISQWFVAVFHFHLQLNL